MCVWLIRVYAFVSGVCELGMDELRVSRHFNKEVIDSRQVSRPDYLIPGVVLEKQNFTRTLPVSY